MRAFVADRTGPASGATTPRARSGRASARPGSRPVAGPLAATGILVLVMVAALLGRCLLALPQLALH